MESGWTQGLTADISFTAWFAIKTILYTIGNVRYGIEWAKGAGREMRRVTSRYTSSVKNTRR